MDRLDEVKVPGVGGGGRGTEGYHVLGVQEKSPGAEAGLEAFFDFIVALNGIRLDRDTEAFNQILEDNVEKTISMTIYSCKSQLTRSIQTKPSTVWGGQGLLGVSVRFCSFQSGTEDVWRTLYVELDSSDSKTVPAETEEKLEQELTDSEMSLPSPTNTIGLQIDFEDPDIYYFAGGRHVALQTDNFNDEFGPLELFPPGSYPVVIVQGTSDTDMEPNPPLISQEEPPPTVSISIKSQQTSEPQIENLTNPPLMSPAPPPTPSVSSKTQQRSEPDITKVAHLNTVKAVTNPKTVANPTKVTIPTVLSPKTATNPTVPNPKTVANPTVPNLKTVTNPSVSNPKTVTNPMTATDSTVPNPKTVTNPTVPNPKTATSPTVSNPITATNPTFAHSKAVANLTITNPKPVTNPKIQTQAPSPYHHNFKPFTRTVVKHSIPSPVPPATKIQVKDVPAVKKREIGEDGWETVRPRYNRSKWSLSSRSSSSSNNDLAMIGGDTKSGGDTDWKDVEDEHVAAEEEKIQEKEAALDSAIREEELIEQELLQVEKDFLQIEARSSVAMRTKATETESLDHYYRLWPSPEALEVTDLDIDSAAEDQKEVNGNNDEADDSFFIDIAGDLHCSKSMEDFLAKDPERVVAMREKLMSPGKYRDSAETLRRHQAKLAKAEMNRERLLESKYNRYVELSERFQSLNETTRKLVEERSELIAKAEERRKRAVEKRQQLLQDIKKKAHDEESKAKEIAFINLLETQIKRNGFMSSAHAKDLEVGGRLQSREEERKLKLEDRFVKLSGVVDRQSKIKRDWELKLAQMQEKRRRTSERILREKQKRERERSEMALEKARGREERISAINAAKQAKKEELKKSIQQKQQDTARRHEENIEHIRQKAIELSVPRTSEDTAIRMCTLCKVVIESEVQELAHLRGRTHLDAMKRMEKEKNPHPHPSNVGGGENFGIKFIADVQVDKVEAGLGTDKNRLKVMKKHCKKLLQKLTVSGKEFESQEVPPQLSGKQWNDQTMNKNKIQKNIREMDRIINLFNSQRGSTHLATSLDRILGETRKVAVRSQFIQISLIGMGLLPVLQKIFECKAPDLPQRVLTSACNMLIGTVFRNLYNSVYILRSSTMCTILEVSSRRWEALIPDGHRWLCASPSGQNEPLPVDPMIAALIELLSTILNVIPDPFDGVTRKTNPVTFLDESNLKSLHARNLDVIGYVVGSGIVDRLSIYCSGVRGAIEGQQMVANLLKDAIDFLTMLVYSLLTSWDQKKPDTSQLLAALESSEIAGAVSMSYSLLLHQGAPARPSVLSSDSPIPPPPGPLSSSLVRSTLSLINAYAKLDLASLQRVLGSEAVSLQFRHIASQLLWQVVPYAENDTNWARLVHELLMALGNFMVANSGNQMTIQSGQTPTVLQQLCALPRVYYDEPKFTRFLFPTLVAATYGCPENEEILTQQKIPMELLHGFMKTDFAKLNLICKRLFPNSTASKCMKSA